MPNRRVLEGPSFGPPGIYSQQWAIYCIGHRPGGYVYVKAEPCRVVGCARTSSCAPPDDSSQPSYCSHHRPAGYISRWSRQCLLPECERRACYGPPGGDRADATYCTNHRPGGYLNVVDRRMKT